MRRQIDYSDPSTFYPSAPPKTADGVEFKLGMTVYEPTYPFRPIVTTPEAHQIQDHGGPRYSSYTLRGERCYHDVRRLYSTLSAAIDADIKNQISKLTDLNAEVRERIVGIALLNQWRTEQKVTLCAEADILLPKEEY